MDQKQFLIDSINQLMTDLQKLLPENEKVQDAMGEEVDFPLSVVETDPPLDWMDSGCVGTDWYESGC